MLRVSPACPGSRGNERTSMGNSAVAVQLPGAEELDELYRLDASEPEPEPEDDGDEDEDEADGDEGIQPEEMPHP
jgi:hypothetical protein